MSELESPSLFFDYNVLDEGTRTVIRQHTLEIKVLIKRTAQGVIEIGQRLIQVKALLGHGAFLTWLEVEFDWAERTARNFMRAAEAFKTANFADLDFAPSALYLLASPSTPESAREQALAQAEAGEAITFSLAKTIVEEYRQAESDRAEHARQILHSSDSAEWYTPKRYVDAVKQVLGEIDLDPASSDIANRTVRAKQIFTIKEDGLLQEWSGRVFLSPPYGFRDNESNQGLWSGKLIDAWHSRNITAAILLANAMTASKWFQPLWEYMLCFCDHQIRFYRPDGSIGNQPTHASVFVYLGKAREKFEQVFSQFGCIVERRGSGK